MSMLLLLFLLAPQRQSIDEAWDLLAKGDRIRAAQVLDRILQANPRDPDAHLMLGSLLAEDGRIPEALPHLEEAVRLRPRSAQAHQALGEVLRDSGNPEASRSAFEKAVALDPAFAQARIDLGLALLTAGDSKSAAVHLDQAIRLLGRKPDAAYPLYIRAKIHSQNSETSQAAALLDKAVAVRPDFAEAWSDLGQARKTLQNDSAALTAFQRSVELDPANAISQYRLGAEFLRQGDPHRAVEHLQQAFRLNPKDQSTLNSLQIALRQDGHIDEAKRIKEKLTEVLREIDRESQAAFNALRLNNEGAALEKSGDLHSALSKYREALALDPTHNGIRVNFAIAALRLGLWDEGISHLQEALRREPSNPQIKSALTDALRQKPGQRP